MSQLLHRKNRVTKTDLDAVDVDPLTGDPTHHDLPTVDSTPADTNALEATSLRRFSVVVAAAAGLLIATVAIASNYVVTQAEAGQKLEIEKSQKAAMSSRFTSSEQLIGTMTLGLDKPQVEVTSVNGLGGKAADGYGVYSTASQQIGSRHYSNPPVLSAGTGLRVDDPQEAVATYKQLIGFFDNHNFSKTAGGVRAPGLSVWDSANVVPVAYTVYSSEYLVCLVSHVDGTRTPLQSHVLGTGCGDTSSYEQAARTLDPFYAAYSKSFTRPASYTALGAVAVHIASNGTKRATVTQSDTDTKNSQQFEGVYTQQPGKSNWVYIGTVDEQHP